MPNLIASAIGIVERALIKPPRIVYRSAKSGRFVSKAFAEANPDSTMKERIG